MDLEKLGKIAGKTEDLTVNRPPYSQTLAENQQLQQLQRDIKQQEKEMFNLWRD